MGKILVAALIAVVVGLLALSMLGAGEPSAGAAQPKSTTVLLPHGSNPAFAYFPIPFPSAVVVQDGDTLRTYPLPPGCILGIPTEYLAEPDTKSDLTLRRGK